MRLFASFLFILFNIYLIKSENEIPTAELKSEKSESEKNVPADKSENTDDLFYEDYEYIDSGTSENGISGKSDKPKGNTTETDVDFDGFPNEVFLSLRNITADAATAFRSFTNRNDVNDLQASASDNLNVTSNDTFGDAAESAGINLRALRDAGHPPEIIEESHGGVYLPYKHVKIDTADLSDCALQGEWKPMGVAHSHLHQQISVASDHQAEILQSVGSYSVPSKVIPQWSQNYVSAASHQDYQDVRGPHNHKPATSFPPGFGVQPGFGSNFGYGGNGVNSHSSGGLYSNANALNHQYGSGVSVYAGGFSGQFQKIKSGSMLSPPPIPPIILGKKPGFWKSHKPKIKFHHDKRKRPYSGAGSYGITSHVNGNSEISSGYLNQASGGGSLGGSLSNHKGYGSGGGSTAGSSSGHLGYGYGYGSGGSALGSLAGHLNHGYGLGGGSGSSFTHHSHGSAGGSSLGSSSGHRGHGYGSAGGSTLGSSSGHYGHGYGFGGASISGSTKGHFGHGYGSGGSSSGHYSQGGEHASLSSSAYAGSSVSAGVSPSRPHELGSAHSISGSAGFSGSSSHGSGGAAISDHISHELGTGHSVTGISAFSSSSGHGSNGASLSGPTTGHLIHDSGNLAFSDSEHESGGVVVSGPVSDHSSGSGIGYPVSENSGYLGAESTHAIVAPLGHGAGDAIALGHISQSVGNLVLRPHPLSSHSEGGGATDHYVDGGQLISEAALTSHLNQAFKAGPGGDIVLLPPTADNLNQGTRSGHSVGHALSGSSSAGNDQSLSDTTYHSGHDSGSGNSLSDSTFSSSQINHGIGNSLPDAAFLSSHLNHDIAVHGQGISDDLSSSSTFTCGKTHDHNTKYHTATFQVADHDHPSSVDVLQYQGDAAVLIQAAKTPFHSQYERKNSAWGEKGDTDASSSDTRNELLAEPAQLISSSPVEQELLQTEKEPDKITDDGEEPERHSYYHEITKVTKIPATSVGSVQYTYSEYETKPQSFSQETGTNHEEPNGEQPQIIRELEQLSNKFQLDLENPQKLFEDPPSQNLAYHYPFEGHEEVGKQHLDSPEGDFQVKIKEENHDVTEYPQYVQPNRLTTKPDFPVFYHKKPQVKYIPRPGKPQFYQKTQVNYLQPRPPVVVLRKHKPKHYLKKKQNYEVQEHSGERHRPVGEIFPPQKFPKQFHNPKPNFAVDRPKNGWRPPNGGDFSFDFFHGKKVKKFKTQKQKIVAPVLIRRPVSEKIPVLRVLEVSG